MMSRVNKARRGISLVDIAALASMRILRRPMSLGEVVLVVVLFQLLHLVASH